MRRARVYALALVNWKGVFYERYLLDQHVTALEGTNGAGKTTVMIAAYMVLLPDMTRLRFTNLGESAPTGGDKGIYGRLGHTDALSFSALDFRLGNGERLLAGVAIERRSEPNLELTPFIVSGLADDVALQDVLLDRGEVDSIPDLNRMIELAARAGGRLKTYLKLTDYFAELFDRGVTPLRLTNDEERTKFNEMLRTSMVGGISRALTGGLREFLLKEETGLADILKRMRGNLDACRRTRFEVEAAQKMEQEIRDVYEAGHEMFVAAVHATRERADEAHQRLKAAHKSLDAAELKHRKLVKEFEDRTREHGEAMAELTKVRANLDDARLAAERIRLANEIFARLSALEHERPELALELERKNAERGRCRAERELARKNLADAQKRVGIAAAGLGDFQTGLDQLHLRASAYRQVSLRLAAARQGLPDREVHPATIGEVRWAVAAQVEDLDATIIRFDREISTARHRRSDFEGLTAAIAAISGLAPEPAKAFEAALAILRELRELKEIADELPSLPSRIEGARRMAEKQKAAWQLANLLSADDCPITSSGEAHAEFASADARLQSEKEELAKVEEAAARAQRESLDAEAKVTALAQFVDRWRTVQTSAEKLGRRWDQPVQGRNDLGALQQRLQSERDRVRDDQKSTGDTRDRVAELADQIAHSGGQFSEALLVARDAVEGELLAGLFDEVGIEEAGYLEAVLGPLAEAILVPDALQAAKELASIQGRPQHLWLVEQDSAAFSMTLQDSEVERMGDSVWVPGQNGTRLTRLPELPTLGRRAREKRVGALRAELDQLDQALLNHGDRLREAVSAIGAAADLMPEVALLERADPCPDLETARVNVDQLAASEKADRERAASLQAQVDLAAARRDLLFDLLAQAQLLDPPDHLAEASRLEKRLTEATKAKARLDRVAPHQKAIEGGLDLLRVPPPSDSELKEFQSQYEISIVARDQLSGPLVALCYVEDNRHALEWSDALAALEEKKVLRPELENQLQGAKQEQKQAEFASNQSENAFNVADTQAQESQARLTQLDAAIERHKGELSATAVEDPSDLALKAAADRHQELRNVFEELDHKERALGAEVAGAKVRLNSQEAETSRLRSARDDEEGKWRPTFEHWQRLQFEAESAGVLRTVMTPAVIERTSSTGSVNLYQEARTQGRLLAERLSRSEGGRERGDAIRASLDDPDQESVMFFYLSAWLETREWLRLRVPPQIAEVDDPLESLTRVRDHLGRLRERLEQQEDNLRGQSEDVARNIETQRRKARREITRLNLDLGSVHFGSIAGVQIQVRPVESRERVLRALRDGEAQQFLFKSEMPIEEAMDELFKNYGGGQTGGQRLLDYREYLDLLVEIKRQDAKEWESANPSRLSTGEAIGVGAAIMMVVLTAWERQANLLRSRRSAGTLRLLFLDEANRLSQDNLAVLFELCQNLELQLLIAAPEVAQSEGNTTFRLVRQLDDSGQEAVRATGRRTNGAAS